MNIKTIVNSHGKIVEICVIQNADGGFYDYILKQGESAVKYLNDVQTITNGVSHPPLKPLWDFVAEEWIELATESELQADYPPQPPPTPNLEERTAATEAAIMAIMGGV